MPPKTIGTMYISVELLQLENGVISLDELAEEIAKKLYRMSRRGTFKLHEKALISDMVGIKPDA